MKESILQQKIVELVKSNSLLDFIINKNLIDEPLKIDEDINYIPDFSIDSLLRRRYAESAKRVLETLEDCELITGEVIRNISLEKSERIFPDLILFNPIKNQIVLVENKTSSQTEREAITELLGYVNEIRNHLPFLSNLDVHFILISSDFNVLLDHSVSAQLLSTHINFLCLKPQIEGKNIDGLDIHFPSSWSDIGQNHLPKSSLVSYTMCLYDKDEANSDDLNQHAIKDINHQQIITMAADLINHQANSYQSSGFSIVWLNSFSNQPDACKAAISIYILNPFTFLPYAEENGFVLNKQSVLYEFLKQKLDENDNYIIPSSLFGIAERAEKLLSNYFDVRWERSSNWETDISDTMYCMQRNPMLFHSFGAIGDFIRYFFLHPAVRKHLLGSIEANRLGYNDPFIALQFINMISGNFLFDYGHFLPSDIFKFARQVNLHLQAQLNAFKNRKNVSMTYDCMLFWTALPLVQSLKEVNLRVLDISTPVLNRFMPFPIITTQKSVRAVHKKQILDFVKWFRRDFLDQENQEIFSKIFDLGFEAAALFDPFLSGIYPENSRKKITHKLVSFSKFAIGGIAIELISGNHQDEATKKLIDETYFFGEMMQYSISEVDDFLAKQPEELFLENFEEVLLSILDAVSGNLIHKLDDFEFPESIDWKWMYQSAKKRFAEGKRKTAIVVSANGQISLGQIEEYLPMILNDDSEVFIHFSIHYSETATILRTSWEKIMSGDFKFSDLGSTT